MNLFQNKNYFIEIKNGKLKLSHQKLQQQKTPCDWRLSLKRSISRY